MFKPTGIEIDDLVKLIVAEKEITKFLLDVQNEYRIQRAMGEDEGNKLLIGTRVIDDILNRLSLLEKARAEYFEQKAKEEAENNAEKNKISE
jgi:hypothetical protein